MRVAIMQPYVLPYWPYVQLMGAVDRFIILDTVQFISGGWMNRNRIAVNGKEHYFTLPVSRHPLSTPVAKIRMGRDLPFAIRKVRRTLEQAYAGRPNVLSMLKLFDDATKGAKGDGSFLELALQSLEAMRTSLGIICHLELASDLMSRSQANAQDYIIELARTAGASSYINAIGGMSLYETGRFAEAGIELCFLSSVLRPYSQRLPRFLPGLSVLDLVANLEKSELRSRLGDYSLIRQ